MKNIYYPKHLNPILNPEQKAREKRFAIFIEALDLTPTAVPITNSQKIQCAAHDHARYFKTREGQLLLFDAPYRWGYTLPQHIATEWVDPDACPYRGNGGTYPRFSCLRTNDIYKAPLVDLQILALCAGQIIYENDV